MPDNGVPTTNWYDDDDGDGYGAGQGVASCSQPPQTTDLDGDCNDSDSTINPLGTETCDGVDEDCNGAIDDGVATMDWYADGDLDGFGAGAAIAACSQPSGTSAEDTDCDDADANTHPGAGEACDGVDNDCNGAVDDDTVDLDWYVDGDGDGFGAGTPTTSCAPIAGRVQASGDCDDHDALVRPGALERCDGVDNDCDGTVDVGAIDEGAWFPDLDGDGHGDGTMAPVFACAAPSGTAASTGDCNDAEPEAHPGRPEVCDGLDNDCNNQVDDDADDAVLLYIDGDGDGFGVSGTAVFACAGVGAAVLEGDCDDTDLSVYPGAVETCDGVDEDCAGDGDANAIGAPQWFVDADGDLFGDPLSGVERCDPLAGEVSDDTDCDDADAQINPDAEEIWYDGVDQDCDGNDLDQDLDGFVLADDCDDLDPAVNPGVDEVPGNDVDEDCDDVADTGDPDPVPDGSQSAPALWFCSATGGSPSSLWVVLALPLWLRRQRGGHGDDAR